MLKTQLIGVSTIIINGTLMSLVKVTIGEGQDIIFTLYYLSTEAFKFTLIYLVTLTLMVKVKLWI